MLPNLVTSSGIGRRLLAALHCLVGILPRRSGERVLPQSRDRGFALLIVVVVIVALSLMFGAVVSATHSYIDQGRTRLALLKLRAASEGALATTIHDLAYVSQAAEFGTPGGVTISGVAVTVNVRTEAAKLDINFTSQTNLARLLRASGIGQTRSDRIATAIVAWRDGSKNGADLATFGVRPPSRPFETIADLALVPYGGSDLLDCLAPDITVFSRSPDVDLTHASERVQNALEEGGRNTLPASSGQSIVGGAAGLPDLYEITMSARAENDNITLQRMVVLRLTGLPRKPAWILADVSPGPDPESTNLACARLAENDK